jgi:hypothetical protein
MSRHALTAWRLIILAAAQVEVWRCAGAGDAGQLEGVLRGYTGLQGASWLIEQEISFPMQTFFGSVKKRGTTSLGALFGRELSTS